VVSTVASRGEGIDEVVEALDAHHDWLTEHGELDARRLNRATVEVEAIAVEQLRERFGDLRGGQALEKLAGQVMSGTLDSYAAADQLVEGLREQG
jgi:LAO/AO transport system kinase